MSAHVTDLFREFHRFLIRYDLDPKDYTLTFTAEPRAAQMLAMAIEHDTAEMLVHHDLGTPGGSALSGRAFGIPFKIENAP